MMMTTMGRLRLVLVLLLLFLLLLLVLVQERRLEVIAIVETHLHR